MTAATTILCDKETYEKAKGEVDFEILDPITVKGRNEPVSIYRPISLK